MVNETNGLTHLVRSAPHHFQAKITTRSRNTEVEKSKIRQRSDVHTCYMSEVAELSISLVSQRDDDLDQLSAIEAQRRFGITAVTVHVLTGRHTHKGGKCNR